jgi:hypothetical protein
MKIIQAKAEDEAQFKTKNYGFSNTTRNISDDPPTTKII